MRLFGTKWLHSFYYASDGIVYSIVSQRNMKIHFFAALFTLLLAMALHIQGTDAIFLIVMIGLVIAAEMVNTALEKTIDLVTKEYHPLAKIAKDTAAGAVLFIVFIAVILGVMLIFPYLNQWFFGNGQIPTIDPTSFFALQSFFLLLFTYGIKAYWSLKNTKFQPHVLIGILLHLMAVLSKINMMVSVIFAFILSFVLLNLLSKGYHWIGLIQNGMISIGGFFLLNGLFI